MSEGDGLTTRELLLEVRKDVKQLLEAALPRRVDELEDSWKWASRAIILQFLAMLAGVIFVVVK